MNLQPIDNVGPLIEELFSNSKSYIKNYYESHKQQLDKLFLENFESVAIMMSQSLFDFRDLLNESLDEKDGKDHVANVMYRSELNGFVIFVCRQLRVLSNEGRN